VKHYVEQSGEIGKIISHTQIVFVEVMHSPASSIRDNITGVSMTRLSQHVCESFIDGFIGTDHSLIGTCAALESLVPW
jgi:hypothetical protein